MRTCMCCVAVMSVGGPLTGGWCFYRAPALPQTLTLDHVSPATRLLEKRRQMFEVCVLRAV